MVGTDTNLYLFLNVNLKEKNSSSPMEFQVHTLLLKKKSKSFYHFAFINFLLFNPFPTNLWTKLNQTVGKCYWDGPKYFV